MARLRSADGADKAALGPVFTGDSPGWGHPRPLPVSLVLRPVTHSISDAHRTQDLSQPSRSFILTQSSC